MLKRKKSLLREAPEDPSKAYFARNHGVGRKNFKRRDGTFGDKQNLEEMMKEKRNAKVEEGREKEREAYC